MRIALAVAALLLAACSSQSTVETKQVTDNTPADGRRKSEVHTALAGEYYARGNFPVALAETRAAIKDDPGYFNAYNMQGLVLMELREDNQARALVALVKGRVACKFNLIPFNPFPASGLTRSPRERVTAFAKVLQDAGIVTTIRKTRGDDIDAACGQLAGEVQDRTHAQERMTRAPIRVVTRSPLTEPRT